MPGNLPHCTVSRSTPASLFRDNVSVHGLLEIFQQFQHVMVGEGQNLCHQQAAYIVFAVDPKVRIQHARPSQASRRPPPSTFLVLIRNPNPNLSFESGKKSTSFDTFGLAVAIVPGS